MFVRLGFSVAAHLECKILVVDEVLAVGDLEFQNKCIGKMHDISASGRTVLFVSHNLSSVKKLCNKGLLLEHGRSTFFGGIDETIQRYLMNRSDQDKDIIDLSNFGNRTGNGDMKFVQLELQVNHKTGRRLMMGDTLSLRLKIRSLRKVRYKMAIHIYRGDQTRVANIENMDSHLVLEPFEGEREMQIDFENVMFYPNNYLLGLWIGDISSHEHIDYVKNCAQFEIIEGAESVPRALHPSEGIVFLSPKWQLI